MVATVTANRRMVFGEADGLLLHFHSSFWPLHTSTPSLSHDKRQVWTQESPDSVYLKKIENMCSSTSLGNSWASVAILYCFFPEHNS